MRKLFFCIVLSLIGLGSITAQTFIGKINPFPSSVNKKASLTESLNILAVMVEFQADKDGSTVGNGKFGTIYSKDYGKTIIDPLPFDKAYFSSHLEFAKNYFRKVSGSKLNISYNVLPQVYTVSKTIRDYSPAPKTNDFTGLGNFSQEVWKMVDSANPGFDFGAYDIFIVFHAGVGRDVSLPGSLGNERDMPSVYLGTNSLKKIFGDTFTGFSAGNGKYKITNSMILPCTESREVSSFGSTYLFEITINGLLVSSIGSHLGLPDLFDTKTGLTAIGRFGLMDGQSIFAFAGAFPPEPSAWEKIYLGWAEPVTVTNTKTVYNLAASLAATNNDTVILKVPINSTEYYLVENRIRDVNKDGAKVTYCIDSVYYTKQFLKDTTFFYSASVDSLAGVITDVDEFDWAGPGNGIVIWHIDENIINSKIADNKVNADKTGRGVAVEEADGIKDIGEQFTTIFGDIITGEGTEDDFWFGKNPSKLFTGRFDKNSRPNTNTNSGANSLISMYDFSEIGNKMSLKIVYGDSLIKPVLTIKSPTTSGKISLSYLKDASKGKIVLSSFANLSVLDLNNPTAFSSEKYFTSFKPTIHSYKNINFIIGAFYDPFYKSSRINMFCYGNEFKLYSFSDTSEFIGSPVIYTDKNDGKDYISVSCRSGNDFIVKLPESLTDNPVPVKKQNIFNLPVYKTVDSKDGYVSYMGSNFIGFTNGVKSMPPVEGLKDMLVFKDSKGRYITAALLADQNTKSVLFFSPDFGNSYSTGFSYNDSLSTSISAADLKNDGENYIVYTNGLNIEARNQAGAMALNFPFIDPAGKGFSGTPLVYDFAGDKKPEIIAATKDGRIFAIDGGTGKVVTGFPISTGASLTSVPACFTIDGQAYLAALSSDKLDVWIIGSTPNNPAWGEENGNAQNNSYLGAASKSDYVNTFFPPEKVYNYPNPAYDNVTYIRYYVSEDSKINIKIFDIAGDFVAEMNRYAPGGMESETAWHLEKIHSGVYLARVEATGSTGKTESKIIKIAVVK